MKIEESNKLIAEFMDLKPAFANEKDDYGYTQTVDGFIRNEFEIPYSVSELKYHEDWNWLIPVAQKIYTEVDLRQSEQYYAVIHIRIIDPIEIAYSIIVAFIQWHNLTTK